MDAVISPCKVTWTLVLLLALPVSFSSARSRSAGSVENAARYIDRGRASNRILVPLLSNNQKQLCHILNNMQEHVLPWNSMDIFVFSPENEALWELECPQAVVHCNAALDPTSKPCDVNNTEVFFMPLREEWRTPQEAGDSAFWLNTFWDEGYRRMGHWRLTFQMDFARRLGYTYVLQIDDDSFFPDPVEMDILHTMRTRNIDVAVSVIKDDESIAVTSGLPELTRYYLVTEQLEFPPTLARNCNPPTMEGLYTSTSWNSTGGWNRKILYGNFLLLSVNFWYRRDVQNFVQLVLRTGSYFRLRWNEQPVTSMIWQVFVKEERFYKFEFPYVHPYKVG